ncbi:serine/threonine protein phosphatase [Leptolyngbyaceae cyanobacterium CCMR0082]|uniref:Serine/threonine protein phosphatase n=2 Tax=Adonisia turfae TaxID=2950184 RepID=A0A6M0RZI8_9CYAN|nr:metallophosphoesterase [Adonisia turfae]MDV3349783.1 metallophosphoesterase [Leptothoe sp. LEGE 181152]NEZ54751.1 serine/threonine protein phosphatase [Adonisia turfae CCMR0081]NEZ61303.1 serine/threonine protein phosphatase [Adonisia turfae CCMR0082]
MPRRIFIGDIHGHYDGLMRLLEAVDLNLQDEVYFVGDLIDRGPQSRQVVNYVRDNGYRCVMGNHEQLLLEAFPNGEAHMPAFQGWLYSGGQSTLSSYTSVDDLFDHVHWIQDLPLYMDLGDIWLVHAGLNPQRTLEEQTSHEYCWIRDGFHSHKQPYFPDKLIITGHTITFTLPGVEPGEIARGPGWLDIDTGAYHPKSGWLTALDMDGSMVYQFNVFNNMLRIRPIHDAAATVEQHKIKQRSSQLVNS